LSLDEQMCWVAILDKFQGKGKKISKIFHLFVQISGHSKSTLKNILNKKLN